MAQLYIPTNSISGKSNQPATGNSFSKGLINIKDLDENLNKKILGQEKAIAATVNSVKLYFARLRNKNRPAAVLFFTGPSGVGKTELARELAKQLDRHLVRFDLSEYQEKVSVTKLIGASPGYAGFEQGGLLLNQIHTYPQAVVLFDEIEKAHPDVFNILLQVMDYATLTDNKGCKADFRKVIIIMTSNAGAKEVGRELIGFGDRIQDNSVMDDAVKKIFTPEFRNRLDAVVKFDPLSPDIINSIVRKELEELAAELKIEQKINLSITEAVIQNLAKESFSREFGAREVSRLIERHIKSLLVDEILFGSLSRGGGSVKIDWRDGYCIEIEKEGIMQKLYRKTLQNLERKPLSREYQLFWRPCFKT